MPETLGSQADVVQLLRGLMLSGEVARNGDRGPIWLGRSPSHLVSAEVEGEPVVRVSLALPARKGAGEVAGAFLNTFASGSRGFLQKCLKGWKVADEVLDESAVFGERTVRVQGFVTTAAMVVITVEAG